MDKKRKTRINDSQSNISIEGEVKGIGNVIGHGSRSNIKIDANEDEQKDRLENENNRSRWFQVIGFLLGLIGGLFSIALFIKQLTTFSVEGIILLVISLIIAVLGTIGVIRPESVAKIFLRILGKL